MPGVGEGVVAHRDEVPPFGGIVADAVGEIQDRVDGDGRLHALVGVALGAELDARVAVGVRGDVEVCSKTAIFL